MALLEIKNVSKTFEDHLIVNNLSINVNKGEFFTLLGPSGCGKTTLLRIIAGFVTPDSGGIILDGIDITNLPPEERQLHTVFQSYALFPHMTVFDNIAFPLKMSGVNKKLISDMVHNILEKVQLLRYINRYPNELSGGQKQRVAIARSLVNRPKLLLLDEPLSALDANLREHMHVELVKLQEESGVTFVYVTHDQSEALALSSRIAVMNLGNIEQQDQPQIIYSKPSTYFVADFLGKCNLLKAVVIAKTDQYLTLRLTPDKKYSQPSHHQVLEQEVELLQNDNNNNDDKRNDDKRNDDKNSNNSQLNNTINDNIEFNIDYIESEHKDVAYDVYQTLSGNYLLRVSGFMIAFVTILGGVSLGALLLPFLRKPSNLISLSFWKEAKSSASLLFGYENGVFGSTTGHIFDYFRPDFHPNDHDTSAYLKYYKEKLLHPETGVLTPFFVKEFTPAVRAA